MSNQPVRFGLIGYGAWGQHHAASIAKTEDAQLVAIAEHSEESRKAAQEAHPDTTVVAYYRELVERDDLDAVDVIVPNLLHHEVATAVLSSGKHLLLEKPMCLSMKECDDLLRLAQERNLRIAINHEFRLSSLWGKAKELIDFAGIWSSDAGDSLANGSPLSPPKEAGPPNESRPPSGGGGATSVASSGATVCSSFHSPPSQWCGSGPQHWLGSGRPWHGG